MSAGLDWLTSFWRPKIKETTTSSNTPNTDNLWEKCPKCDELEYHKNWLSNLYVCAKCGHHRPINAKTRFDSIFDEYEQITLDTIKPDPIKFSDRKPYTQRLQELQKQGLSEAISLAQGSINQQDAIVAAMDFNFIGGSMGAYVGQAIIKACDLARAQKLPFICFAASGGARMQEGIYSLMQMPRTTFAVENLKKHGVPFIVVLTHPSMGGVLASFAMLGDITIAEPGATIGFSGRRVIENAIHQTLPDDFQTSQFQYQCGFVDQIITRSRLKTTLSSLLANLAKRKIHPET